MRDESPPSSPPSAQPQHEGGAPTARRFCPRCGSHLGALAASARVYYYAAGTRGTGEPLVFIHGFPTSSHLWRDVVPLLPDGHRAIVIDLLGYGRSDRPN